MAKKQVYQGIIRSGRGAAANAMATLGVLEGYKQLTGLSIIPGTVNITLTKPLDLTQLNYIRSADYGWELDLAKVGIEYEGEQGFHHRLILVAGQYPASIIVFNWVDDPTVDVEIVSPHHLRSALNLQDVDTIEFTLVEN